MRPMRWPRSICDIGGSSTGVVCSSGVWRSRVSHCNRGADAVLRRGKTYHFEKLTDDSVGTSFARLCLTTTSVGSLSPKSKLWTGFYLASCQRSASPVRVHLLTDVRPECPSTFETKWFRERGASLVIDAASLREGNITSYVVFRSVDSSSFAGRQSGWVIVREIPVRNHASRPARKPASLASANADSTWL